MGIKVSFLIGWAGLISLDFFCSDIDEHDRLAAEEKAKGKQDLATKH